MSEDNKDKEEKSSVISPNKKGLLKYGVILVALAIVAYVFFSGGNESSDNATDTSSLDQGSVKKETALGVAFDNDPAASLPLGLPEMPDLIAPVAAPPPPSQVNSLPGIPVLPQANVPPPVVDMTAPVISYGGSSSTSNSTRVTPNIGAPGSSGSASSSFGKKNRDGPILVVSGNIGSPQKDVASDQSLEILNLAVTGISQIKEAWQDKPIINENSQLSRTSFPQVQASYIGLMSFIIAQGKFIDAVLESAVDTDLVGMLRGIVSRDVYSESGRNVLIPKGSRLIGSYNSNVKFGQSRVDVVWNRLMLPNGIDISLTSPGTDNLGRTGVSGDVDNKFTNMIATAFLISSLKIGSGVLIDKISEGKTSLVPSDNKSSDSVQANQSPLEIMTSSAATDITNSFTNYAGSTKDFQPTVRINQGSKIKVFVNKDLVFPKDALIGLSKKEGF